jgi:hypothetical protein
MAVTLATDSCAAIQARRSALRGVLGRSKATAARGGESAHRSRVSGLMASEELFIE